MTERIVVVGHGAVTCLGRHMDATWEGLIAGKSGIRREERLRPDAYLQNIVGMVPDFEPNTPDADPATSKLAVRSIHLGLAAAREAWADARCPETGYEPDRVGVVMGSALGGMDLYAQESTLASSRKNLATSPYLVPGLIINQIGGQVCQNLKFYGPSLAPANACASGGHAILVGAMLLRAGEADFALCGAAESAFTPPIVNGFATMRALMPRRESDRSWDDPSQASRPFSADRMGFVLSEGAGALVLTTASRAKALGLTPQAELLGGAMNSDGHHMALPDPVRVLACLQSALGRSGLRPDQIQYYNAHGTSTVVNDQVETKAVKLAFGDHSATLPVSSVKGALGHSLGAASAIEATVCVRALREQVIPPTINYRPDPELDLDFVPGEGRRATLNAVMTASFGFGGTNNALVFARWADD